jgi:copper transport protein
MSHLRRALGACAAALAVTTFVGVGRVSAHAELLSSDPKPGEVLDSSPAHITLTFNEPVEITLGAVRLFDGTGSSIDISPARHPDGRGATVEVDVPHLANGSYVVDWRVVSSDSHPLHAAYTFQIGPDSNLAAGLLDQIITSSHTGGPASIGLTISRSLVIASIAIVFGGLLVCGLGIVPFGRRQRIIIGASAAVGSVAGILALPLEVSYTAGRSLGVITDGSAWRAVLDTTIGLAWVIRALSIAFVAAILLATRSRCRSTWWQLILITGLVTVGTASAYGGHGASGRWHYLGVFATMLHVSSMAVWLGGLLLLMISLAEMERNGVARFSSIAAVAMTTIVVSGVAQAVRQVGSLDALTGTSYGKLLIWKLIVVAGVLAVAAVARRSIHGRLFNRSLTLASVGASVGAAAVDDDFDRGRLRRAISIESVLAIVIVVITSLLMAANPSQAAVSAPFSSTLTSNGYLATVTVAPARVGPNDLHIYLSSPNSSLDQPDAVTVTIDDPFRDVNPITLDVTKAGAGHYISNAATFPYAATWRLVVTARYGFDEVVFTNDVKVV